MSLSSLIHGIPSSASSLGVAAVALTGGDVGSTHALRDDIMPAYRGLPGTTA
eukprot:CAMPEP_0196718258 /NCGR_PEP_ID=MMETSP1091-20130531/1511_1 /TAXON_ID=302021 /ORGANISM="Rhodomonas sp., Strain CCMP768" /LENGTH=51 /DNA_ID=CAMNT_0042058875 /DNA_START=121 /DNA_END=276 /DNA_ORIENTATION=-